MTPAPKPRRKFTPYQRIVRAARRRVGVRLSPEECAKMSTDTAIRRLADNDDEMDADPEGYKRGDYTDG